MTTCQIIPFPNTNAALYFKQPPPQGEVVVTSAARRQAAESRARREAVSIGDEVYSVKHDRIARIVEIDIDVETRCALRFHTLMGFDGRTVPVTLRAGEFHALAKVIA